MFWNTRSGDPVFLVEMFVSPSTFFSLTTSKARRLQTALPTAPPAIRTRLRPRVATVAFGWHTLTMLWTVWYKQECQTPICSRWCLTQELTWCPFSDVVCHGFFGALERRPVFCSLANELVRWCTMQPSIYSQLYFCCWMISLSLRTTQLADFVSWRNTSHPYICKRNARVFMRCVRWIQVHVGSKNNNFTSSCRCKRNCCRIQLLALVFVNKANSPWIFCTFLLSMLLTWNGRMDSIRLENGCQPCSPCRAIEQCPAGCPSSLSRWRRTMSGNTDGPGAAQNISKSMPPIPAESTSLIIFSTFACPKESLTPSPLRTSSNSSLEMCPSPSRSRVRKALHRTSRLPRKTRR